jgi:hypothetical protein
VRFNQYGFALRMGCPYRKSNPEVLKVQTSEVRSGNDAANCLSSAQRRCSFVQRYVRASVIVISLVRYQKVPKVPLAEHHDVIKAISPDRADEPLCMAILPG